jgi:hypothetical protein
VVVVRQRRRCDNSVAGRRPRGEIATERKKREGGVKIATRLENHKQSMCVGAMSLIDVSSRCQKQ